MGIMLGSKRFHVAFTAAAFAAALGSLGCAQMKSDMPLGVSPEPMPQGAEWQGVYQGPYHIYLSITRTGDHAQGTWRAMGGRSGALWGDLSGNVMKFRWSEHDLQNNGSWSGHGYFVYRVKEDQTPEIRGEWGLGMSDSDGLWIAVKRPEVPVAAAEQRLADNESSPSGSGGSDEGTGCMGAACVGDDREISEAPSYDAQ
jgi:hypothetical protein